MGGVPKPSIVTRSHGACGAITESIVKEKRSVPEAITEAVLFAGASSSRFNRKHMDATRLGMVI